MILHVPIGGFDKFDLITRPSIVLVHGGFLSREFLLPLEKFLKTHRYVVSMSSLPSCDVVPATKDWSLDVRHVKGRIDHEVSQGKEVVVVAHSYGAAVVCEAMRGVPVKVAGRGIMGGVIKLAFIAGWIPRVGEAVYPLTRTRTTAPGMTLEVGQSS